MRTPAQADLKRWSDDVARDPRSLAFLPLARAYRRRGLSEAATTLCLRGLEAYPTHVEAHGLLALLYLDRGDHQRAADEWSMVLRLDPDNFDALRGMGFCYLEQDHLSRARQMLERAALLRPTEPTVQEALRVLGTRQELAHGGLGDKPALTAEQTAWAHEVPADKEQAAPPADAGAEAEEAEPWLASPDVGHPPERAARRPQAEVGPASKEDRGQWPGYVPQHAMPADAGPVSAGVHVEHAAPEPTVERAAPAAGRAAARDALLPDPERLFDMLLAAGPVTGALLVDAHGLVLAGRMTSALGADAAVLGAVVGGAAGEAVRTASLLKLGEWQGIHIEAGDALLHLVPASSAGVVVLAARPSTPAGWLRRAAEQAAERACGFMEVYG
jgi:predicted regulator of Ras-like GTPase activity (Roadblock/LC7/MglB family)/tetratricopeptide (TPR) repeat protein